MEKPEREVSWLQTLSLLESIGARKIAKTVGRGSPSLEVKEHLADEERHAVAFGGLVRQLAGGAEVVPLCGEAAVGYFQGLDRQVSHWMTELSGREDPWQNYLLVTALIERRAMRLYPLYRQLTRNDLVRDELGRIIEEEARHRQTIEGQGLKILQQYGVSDFAAGMRIEAGLFSRLEVALQCATAATQ